MRIAIAKLVSKSYEEMGRRTYKNVPTNDAIRFSGPMTVLTTFLAHEASLVAMWLGSRAGMGTSITLRSMH
jgi:hypothetical protein